jgi:hypothetical protein
LQPPAGHELTATEVAQPAVALTQAPLQSAKPLAQTKVQAPATHADSALATPLVQALPQPAQLRGLLVVSTQVFEHTVGAVDGQLAAQAYVSPEPTHTGVLPVHSLPQLPQLEALDGSRQPAGHASMPGAQVGRTPPSGEGLPLSITEVASTVFPPSTHPSEHMPAEYPSSPEMLAHPPSAATRIAAVAHRKNLSTLLLCSRPPYGATRRGSAA